MDRRLMTVLSAAFILSACASTPRASSEETAAAQAPERSDDVATAQETKGSEGPPSRTGSISADEVTGRVALVDQANREVAVDAGDATTQFRVADDAEITVDGQRASLADLRQGAQIRASLDRSGDLPEATRIEITPSESK